MKRATRKWMIAGAAGVALLAVGGWQRLRGNPEPKFQTASVERGNIEKTVNTTGTSNALVTVQVGSQISGNILELHADYNSEVKKGQLLARLDPSTYEARLSQVRASLESSRAAVTTSQAMVRRAEADVANARANVAKAQATAKDSELKLKRQTTLFHEGIASGEAKEMAEADYASQAAQVDAAQAGVSASQASLDAARMQLAQAQAQVKQNEASVQQAEVDLSRTSIYAPLNGVVVARRVDVGQTVAASLQAPTLFEIAQDLTQMKIDTNVDESDIGAIQVGQPASFTVDAYPGETFRGKVIEIRKEPLRVDNVVTYNVVVAFQNPDTKLLPGMTANVKIQVAEAKNVLRVPNAALRAGSLLRSAKSPSRQQHSQAVWILDAEGKPKPVPVQTGISDGMFTEVASDRLSGGEKIIVDLASTNTARTQTGTASPFGGTTGGPRRGPRL